MGAWGIHFDEYDGGLDFLGDVEESQRWADVESRIDSYISEGGYEEADETLVALELVAAALGHPSTRLAAELVEWAKRHAASATTIRQRSIEAVSLVSRSSELSELWAEADEGEDWQATVTDLKLRLQA